MPLLLLLACNDYDVQKLPPGANGEDAAPVIEVDPPALAFDALPSGSSALLPLTVTNTGNVVLTVDELLLTGTAAFTLVDAAPFSLDPGASTVLDVAFSPMNPADEGVLTITSDDPDRGTLAVPITGAALEPELLLYPNPLDFGVVPLRCSLALPVHLYNDGLAPLEVTAIGQDGEGWSVDLPFVLPLTLAPGEEAVVDVRLTPSSEAETTGALYVTSNDLVPLRTAAQRGAGTLDGSGEEVFVQGDGPWEKTDILLYVDGSCSMADDQRNLAANAASFAEALEGWSLDWQLLVATRDSGCGNGWLDVDTISSDALLTAVGGPVGTFTEAGLTIARNAVAATDGGCNDGFLRPDSKTTIILVSDEPEQSRETPEALVDEIRDAAPSATIHSVAGDVPRGCATAAPGTGYDEAAALTGGAFLSICDADWGSYFTTIAERAASGQTDTFSLDGWPDPTTIAVTVDGGTAVGWSYDADQNAIVFEAAHLPAPGATITVTYALDATCED